MCLMIKKSRLRWFGHVARKMIPTGSNEKVKELEIRNWKVKVLEATPEEDLIHCIKYDVGLSQKDKDTQFRNKWRRESRGQLANPDSPGKMGKWPLKHTVCVCACVSCCLYTRCLQAFALLVGH